MSRILVSGATGFIGRHALPMLIARGYEVHAIGRSPLRDTPHVQWHECDLLMPGETAPTVRSIGAEHLLHLAWNATPGAFWTAPDNFAWVAATTQLHDAFKEAGGRRAVFAGSCAEYDWSFDLLTEDETPLRPRTLYGQAKLAAAERVLAANVDAAWSVAWGRIFFVYGPGEPRGKLVSDLVASLLAGKPVDCTHGRHQRDYMHVADVARALVELLGSDFRGSVNIASGECRPIAAVIHEVARQIGQPDLVRLGAIALPPDDPPRLAASTRRLFEEIGFRPTFDLAAGIADTIAARRAEIARA